jgi:hypothetical protein
MDRKFLGPKNDPGQKVSRRNLVKGVGIAAAAAAGGSALSMAAGSPAEAATVVESSAIAPDVVALSDGATISVDASLGNDFRLTLGGNHTMGKPSNPANGQQIVFHITQGAGGGFALSWDTAAYEFPAVPQPNPSTIAGQTDLFCFVYSANRGAWLLAWAATGFPSLAAPQGQSYRLFSSVSGPSSPVGYSGPFVAGVAFEVRTGGCWFEGYWWWVCDSGQPTEGQTFALWQMGTNSAGVIISSATVTSGSLTPGQWNYVPLVTPLPLTIGATYIAATGFQGDFPSTNSQFGSGDPYSAGITNGPLLAYSDSSGSAPCPLPNSMPQGLFGGVNGDPTQAPPTGGYDSANFWMDVQVGNTAPVGTTYRIWPNYPMPNFTSPSNDTGEQTMATEFTLSQECTLNNIWFYSPPGVTVLPSRCAIWDVATQTVVAGTDNTSPAWTGAAGSGWLACPYMGVTLPAGDYKTSVYYGGGEKFYTEYTHYFAAPGAAANGIVNGPLTAPNVANASPPGQTTYLTGSWGYPNEFDGDDNGETRWVDVEVTPN